MAGVGTGTAAAGTGEGGITITELIRPALEPSSVSGGGSANVGRGGNPASVFRCCCCCCTEAEVTGAGAGAGGAGAGAGSATGGSCCCCRWNCASTRESLLGVRSPGEGLGARCIGTPVCNSFCTARSSCGSIFWLNRLRCKRMSIGAVRFLVGMTRWPESRFL